MIGKIRRTLANQKNVLSQSRLVQNEIATVLAGEYRGDIIQTRSISQAQLSSECWTVQMQGREACEKCQFKDKTECGGKTIRKTGINVKGYSVPLGRVIP